MLEIVSYQWKKQVDSSIVHVCPCVLWGDGVCVRARESVLLG